MGLGVLEPSQLVVPGTIQLFDNVTDHEMTAHLKHTADGKTILAPQPSDSPNDPPHSIGLLSKKMAFSSFS